MFTPIQGNAGDWGQGREPDVKTLDEADEQEIVNLLVGHKVEKADDEHLVLDNGVVIKAIGRDGGCACSAGCYSLSELNGVDNIITNVEFDYSPASDDDYYETGDYGDGYYRIFVIANNEKINLMQFDGTDGNGYYGTGFEILVRFPDN